jgi:phosphoribosylformylglycinamidine cyclo-ligase
MFLLIIVFSLDFNEINRFKLNMKKVEGHAATNYDVSGIFVLSEQPAYCREDIMAETFMTRYHAAGVNTDQEGEALARLVKHLRRTWPPHGIGRVALDIGYFANVLDLGSIGLAITTDGVGSKVMIAQLMNIYNTVGIDCVAMNVNDLLCVGATPMAMVDYLAIETLNSDMMEAIGEGLAKGAVEANISIAGGETAQLRDIIKGARPGLGFDLAGTAIGTVALDSMIVGQHIEDGDMVVGIESNGIHSNGLSLARQVFLETEQKTLQESYSELDCSLGNELLKPTHIYVREILDILNQGIPVKALIHITSDGFLNLTRVQSKASYIIDPLPPQPAIFSLLEKLGNVPRQEMFSIYNMGVGFCVVVSEHEVDKICAIINSHGKMAYKIGYAKADGQARVEIPSEGLIGKGKKFWKKS